MKAIAIRAPALAKLAATGAVLGPTCDAIHNQLLLSYDVLPVDAFGAKTSLLIPPLLALTYALLGGVFPVLARGVVGDGGPLPYAEPLLALPNLSCDEDRVARALLAVLATCAVIKLSAICLEDDLSNALPLLAAAAFFEWLALDGKWTSLIVGAVVALAGPAAEVPFMELGCWHYLPAAADYFPFHGALADSPATGLSSLTGPCYFAVTQDAIALGRWFDRNR